ncbi:MAG: hypothetical protein IJ831_05350 [Spirochaetales bacterium]|nr:hypothetical protein [Spirochaetales bacterium]
MRKVLLFTLIVLIAITFAFAGAAQSSNDVKLKSTVKDNSGVETPQGGTAIGFVEGDERVKKRALPVTRTQRVSFTSHTWMSPRLLSTHLRMLLFPVSSATSLAMTLDMIE